MSNKARFFIGCRPCYWEPMFERALELLRCPKHPDDRGRLELSEPVVQGDEVMEGVLVCTCCQTRYRIRNGVPRLVLDDVVAADTESTVQRFSEQWETFDFLTEQHEAQFLKWIRPNQPQDFVGQVVLEGGCGKGRHSGLVAKWGAKDVIAVDLGDSVDVAYRNNRGNPSVHVVQANLTHLPIAARSVDIAFSVGVLHHTEDPKASFLSLEKTVRNGGRVIAWVYGRENNGWIVYGVDPLRRSVTSRLPFRAVYELSKLPAAAIMAVGRGIYHPFSKGRLKPFGERLFYGEYIRQISSYSFKEVHNIVHDHLTPTIAFYIPGSEFQSWFEKAGLQRVQIGWHNQNSWRGTGFVPEEEGLEGS